MTGQSFVLVQICSKLCKVFELKPLVFEQIMFILSVCSQLKTALFSCVRLSSHFKTEVYGRRVLSEKCMICKVIIYIEIFVF